MLSRLGKALTILAFSLLCGIAHAATAEQATPQSIYPLKQILFADSVESAQALIPDPSKGFLVLTGPLAAVDSAELEKRLIQGRGQGINDQLLAAIVQVATQFFRQQDYPIAEVSVPPQSIGDGAIRLAVMRGKYRQIKFQGNRWFSDIQLRETLHVGQGQIIRLSELDKAVNWANTNPFRRLRLHIQPVPNTGEADLYIGVDERIPLRLALSYDNTGNDILGLDRYTAALTYGNLWNRDHQLSYQYTTTNHPDTLQAHAFDYRAPLPWQHVLSLSGSAVRIAASLYEGYFSQVGRSYNSDLKYTIPMKYKSWTTEVSGALGFKQSNNDLEFGGSQVLGTTTDTFSSSLGLVALRPDKHGRWVLSANLIGSPGNINSRNTSDAFADSRYRAKARYLYVQFWAQRATVVAPTVTLSNRVILQGGSTTNLLPSEQFSIGGASTVRGYRERIFSGERGILLTHELQKQLPAYKFSKRVPALETSLVGFWDNGRTYVHEVRIGEPKNQTLQSVGVGLRFNIGLYANGSIDYGMQAKHAGLADPDTARLHARFTLAY